MKKSNLQFLGLLSLIFLVLYFLLKDTFNDVVEQLKTSNFNYILLAMLLFLIAWLFKAFVLKSLVYVFNKEYSLKKSYKTIAITAFFNGITPFATGGQPAQIYLLTKEKLSVQKSTNIIIQYTILYQIALILLCTIAIIINKFTTKVVLKGILSKFLFLGFGLNLIVALFLIVLGFSKEIQQAILKFIITILAKFKIVKNKDEKMEKWMNHANEFHDCTLELLSNKKLCIKTLIYMCISLLIEYILPIFLLYSLNIFSVSIIDMFLILSYVITINSLLPLPGSSGGIEFTFKELLIGVTVKNEVAIAVVLLWRFITYYFPIILGAIILLFTKRGVEK